MISSCFPDLYVDMKMHFLLCFLCIVIHEYLPQPVSSAPLSTTFPVHLPSAKVAVPPGLCRYLLLVLDVLKVEWH